MRLGRFLSVTDEAGPLLEGDEALALHHFHSFVLMNIFGDNSYLFGDDNDDHQHSLIGGVLLSNAADVIN